MIKIKDITLGQYFPGESICHRLNPVFKVVIILISIITTLIASNIYSMAALVLVTTMMVLLSKIPLRLYFNSFKMLIIVILFTSLLNLFYGTGEPLVSIGFLTITRNGIENSIIVTVRIISLVFASSILTFTTTPSDLTDAVEIIMKPLKFFGIRTHDIAMMTTIALRFIPTLLEEADKIMMAQKSRGANINSGNIVGRAKSLIPVLVPLFVSAFRRAYDLASAMECRCYNEGIGKTRMKVMKILSTDIIALILSMVVFTGILICNGIS